MQAIGVLIRTLNESALIGRCLETLHAQRSGLELDILVVDSGSTDGTVDIARSHGARIHSVPPDDFDYSTALNIGIERLPHELVVILSAHAIPIGDEWLARITASFQDSQVAGVASRQVPWPGAPWMEVERLARTFGDAGAVYSKRNADAILFSNAASCIRRSVWVQEPFTLPAAEDAEWAERVVAAGWKIVYEAGARVHHSHDEPPRAQARRLIDLHRAGAPAHPSRSRGQTLREAARFLYSDSRAIVRCNEPVRRKLHHLADLVAMVCYYVYDFSRPGTTAEFRRLGT